MDLHKGREYTPSFPDLIEEEDCDQLRHRKEVRCKLEERLERKRLKEDLDDELLGEFDWSKIDGGYDL